MDNYLLIFVNWYCERGEQERRGKDREGKDGKRSKREMMENLIKGDRERNTFLARKRKG